jgi:hypothetical protein
MMKKMLVFIVFPLLLFSNHNVWADPALPFVVKDGSRYEITQELVPVNSIERQIGKVTRYSNEEGTYQGNFSNFFPIGTEYYAIIGIDSSSAIAVKSGGDSYVKANFAGSYNTGSIWSDYKTWFGLAFVVIVLMLLYNIFRNKK